MSNKQKLAKLQEQIAKLHHEADQIKMAESIEDSKSLVGKCFKTTNCYACPEKPEDYWTLYAIITGVSDNGLPLTMTFEHTSRGIIQVHYNKMRSGYDDWDEIPHSEFDKVWNDLLSQLAKLPASTPQRDGVQP